MCNGSGVDNVVVVWNFCPVLSSCCSTKIFNSLQLNIPVFKLFFILLFRSESDMNRDRKRPSESQETNGLIEFDLMPVDTVRHRVANLNSSLVPVAI